MRTADMFDGDVPGAAREAFDAAVRAFRAEYPDAETGMDQWIDLARKQWAAMVEEAKERAAALTAEDRATQYEMGARLVLCDMSIAWAKGKRR